MWRDETRRDGTGRDGMGRDGMGRDTVRSDATRRDVVGSESRCVRNEVHWHVHAIETADPGAIYTFKHRAISARQTESRRVVRNARTFTILVNTRVTWPRWPREIAAPLLLQIIREIFFAIRTLSPGRSEVCGPLCESHHLMRPPPNRSANERRGNVKPYDTMTITTTATTTTYVKYSIGARERDVPYYVQYVYSMYYSENYRTGLTAGLDKRRCAASASISLS